MPLSYKAFGDYYTIKGSTKDIINSCVLVVQICNTIYLVIYLVLKP